MQKEFDSDLMVLNEFTHNNTTSLTKTHEERMKETNNEVKKS